MSSTFKLKLFRGDVSVGSLPVVSEDAMLSPPVVRRKALIDTVNDAKVQYVQLVGFDLPRIIALGGTYLSQYIHMSDGRTYGHGGDYTMTIGEDPTDLWDTVCENSPGCDGDPHLITIENLISSEGDAWNDCVYHLASDGEGWFGGDEDIACRGGCPNVGWSGEVAPYYWEPRRATGSSRCDQWPCGYFDDDILTWKCTDGWAPVLDPDDPRREWGRAVLMFPQNLNLIKIAGKEQGGIGLDANGKVWTWGYTGWGLIGDPTIPYDDADLRCIPYNVQPTWNFIDVASGYQHQVAIRDDGTLWTWGVNWYLQMGLGLDGSGSGSYQAAPAQIGTDTDWVKCWAPHENTVAMKSDGTVWYTGSNNYGEYGDSAVADGCYYFTSEPPGANSLNEGMRQGGGDKVFAHFSAGAYASIGVEADGTVWVWGFADYGQLGSGSAGSDSCDPLYQYRVWTPINLTSTQGVPAFNLVFSDGSHMIGAVSSPPEVWYWGELYDTHWTPEQINFDFVLGV